MSKCTTTISTTPMRIAVACAGLALAAGLATWGMSTSAVADEAADADVAEQVEEIEEAEEESSPFGGMADFQKRDTGDYPDTVWNAIYVNPGNRGCNSCHESLDDLMLVGASNHPIERAGNTSTHNITILDCKSCHDVHSGDYGMYFGDALHAAHYGSAIFTDDLNGNCWSCHATTDAAAITEIGTWSMKLWEEVMYDGGLGGFPDLVEAPYTREFLQFVGHPSGNAIDMDVDDATPFEVEMTQDLTADVNDMFTALNHNGVYGEEDLVDYSHTFTIEGVNNPQTFTYDDLAAMPQATIRQTMQCLVAGSAGHNIYNAEYTGVELKYIVNELCGGLADDNNMGTAIAYDEWCNGGMSMPAEEFLDHAIIALDMNGEPLTYEFGGPIALIAPGMGGGQNPKWIKTMIFSHSDDPFDMPSFLYPQLPGDELNPVSAAWFANDGETFSMADGVELKGYAFTLAEHFYPLAAIEFSTDYGVTWQTFEVPEDFDPYQWATFTFKWNPPAPGTYVIKVHGVNTEGWTNETDAGIIVHVTE